MIIRDTRLCFTFLHIDLGRGPSIYSFIWLDLSKPGSIRIHMGPWSINVGWPCPNSLLYSSVVKQEGRRRKKKKEKKNRSLPPHQPDSYEPECRTNPALYFFYTKMATPKCSGHAGLPLAAVQEILSRYSSWNKDIKRGQSWKSNLFFAKLLFSDKPWLPVSREDQPDTLITHNYSAAKNILFPIPSWIHSL